MIQMSAERTTSVHSRNHRNNGKVVSKRKTKNRQSQLNLELFHFLLHVSALVKSHPQAIKKAFHYSRNM
jgi:hypothetical protein